MTRLTTTIGRLTLKNPVICGAGEQTMTADAIRAALASGAGAVVAKSTNESPAAKEQLDKTDYVLLDAQWNRLPWNFQPPAEASLFGRSGLVQRDFEQWLQELAMLDREARLQDAYVIPSLILSDLEQCAAFAQRIEQAGLRVLELNIGAPHGEEAAKGAIVLERGAARIEAIVRRLREATTLPLWIKLTGQSEDVVGLARGRTPWRRRQRGHDGPLHGLYTRPGNRPAPARHQRRYRRRLGPATDCPLGDADTQGHG